MVPSVGRHDDLAVDDRGAGGDVPGVVGDLLEAFGPVVAAAGEDLDGLVGEVDLDAVAVELDLVDPALAGRHLLDRRASAGSMKPGRGALTPIAAGFLRWKAMVQTRRRLNCRAILSLVAIDEVLEMRGHVVQLQVAARCSSCATSSETSSDQRSDVLKATTRIGRLYWPAIRS